jgi:hypothetical protein
MVNKALAIIFCFLLFANIAAAAELKIIKPETNNSKTFDAAKPTISLLQAKANSDTLNKSSLMVSPVILNNTFANSSQPAMKTESIPGKSVVSGWVSDGLNDWGRGVIDGMYASFDNNSDVNNKFGSARGSLYTVITFVPNPYDDPGIKTLFTNYNALAILFVIIFIFGEWANRNLARMKVTSSVFGEKDLSTSKFWGGLCMCFIALSANFITSGVRRVTNTLSFTGCPTITVSNKITIVLC